MISVIVPAYERRETLGTTLESLIAQTFTAWEAIVVDDGSTDGTALVAADYAARDERIRVHRQANAGVSRARNAGIELAREPWLFFLDADDWIVPEAFATLVGVVDADQRTDVAYGGYIRVDARGRELQRQLPAAEPDFFALFARTCAVSVHSCLTRAELVRRVGGFDPALVTCEDWDLWQRLARIGARFRGASQYIARYRMRPGSASGDGRRMLADGLLVIDRGHGDDPRLDGPLPERPPLSRSRRDLARTYFTCYAAGLEIAGGEDACALLDALEEGPTADVDPSGVADTLFHALSVGRACGPEWEELPPELHRACDRFIDELGERVGSHWLAFGARNALERLLLGATRDVRPRQSGRWYLMELDVTGAPPLDLELDPGITRVLCELRHGERRIGSVEVPVVDGWLSARVLADAIVAEAAWDVLRAHLEPVVEEELSIEERADGVRVQRAGAVVFAGPLEVGRERAEALHDAIGWVLLLHELFAQPSWTSDDFYAERDDDADTRPLLLEGDTVTLDVADPLPRLELRGHERVAVAVQVCGVPLTVVRCEAREGRISSTRLRRAILLQTGFELCRVVLREAVVLAPEGVEGSLRERMAAVLARRRADGVQPLPPGATIIGRGVGADGTAVSRWNTLPAAAATERIALARLDGDPVAGPQPQAKRLLCAPVLLDPADVRRHPSDDATLRLLEFERIFSAGADPWSYHSRYEQEKYRQTLALLPERVERALELGCAEGVFTELLAPRVEALTAIDISPRALARARRRCAHLPHVAFGQLDLFEEPLPGRFDLIVCSELLYYAPGRATLARVARALADGLAPGGHLVAAHAHVLVDDERAPGFDWDVPFGAATIERELLRTRSLDLVSEIRTEPYRVQLYRRRSRTRRLPLRRPPLRVSATAAPLEAVHAGHFRPRGRPVHHPEQAEPVASASRLPILMYHRVAPSGRDATRRFRLHPDDFEAQLRHLRERGYRSITLEQWRAATARRATVPARSIILTFDDGYADFPTYALPLLRRYGFQATIFVVTDLVGGTNVWDEAQGETIELMDWPTLLELGDHGVELGSHSATHRPLVSLPAAELTRDLCRSRACLHERTGVPVRSIGYPFGLSDAGVRAIAAACGFHFGVTTDEWQASYGDDLLRLPRLEVRGTQSLESFAAMLER